mmetsp:Transcript_57079/g.101977  ORF Transcript_57079/g.101977 Transcript_57079/m.101977 type:complete len:627 (-) Transcript_57079:1056-2936(-)
MMCRPLHTSGEDMPLMEDYILFASRAFNKAMQMRPDDPKAYAQLAQFFCDIKYYDKCADYFKFAQQRTKEGTPEHAAMTNQTTFANFAFNNYEVERMYDGGNGDLVEVISTHRGLLDLYPYSDLIYGLALHEVMHSETDFRMGPQALQHYKEAAKRGLEQWLDGREQIDEPCEVAGSAVVSDWAAEGHPDDMTLHSPKDPSLPSPGRTPRATYGKPARVHLRSTKKGARAREAELPSPFSEGSTYLAKFESVSLFGNNGVIVAQSDTGCRLYISSPYVNLANNVPMVHPLTGGFGRPYQPAPPSIQQNVINLGKAALVVQFGQTSFYHIVTEVLGRVLLLQPLLEADPDIHLIYPRASDGHQLNGFLALLPWLNRSRLVGYKMGGHSWAGGGWHKRFEVDTLWYANWDPVGLERKKSTRGPVPVPSSAGLHCLLPRAGLQLIRNTFVPEAPHPLQRRRIILCPRKENDGPRASKGMDVLQTRLTEWVKSQKHYKLDVFQVESKGSKEAETASKDIRHFSEAAAVVGVHGGALANIVFCSPGTLVVEIGFLITQSWHYYHTAQALDLNYTMVQVETAPQGLNTALVEFDIDRVMDVVLQGLPPVQVPDDADLMGTPGYYSPDAHEEL